MNTDDTAVCVLMDYETHTPMREATSFEADVGRALDPDGRWGMVTQDGRLAYVEDHI